MFLDDKAEMFNVCHCFSFRFAWNDAKKTFCRTQEGILSNYVKNWEQNVFKSEIRFDLCLFEKFHRLNHL